MSANHWVHVAHAAAHSDSKFGAIVLIFVGFLTMPILIGFPLMILGAIKLFK